MLCTLFSNLRYGGHAKVVHFLGKTKPWSYKFDPRSQQITGSVHDADTHSTFLVDWWILYSSAVVPMMQQQYGDQPFHSGCEEVNGEKTGLSSCVTYPPGHMSSSLMDVFCLSVYVIKFQSSETVTFQSEQVWRRRFVFFALAAADSTLQLLKPTLQLLKPAASACVCLWPLIRRGLSQLVHAHRWPCAFYFYFLSWFVINCLSFTVLLLRLRSSLHIHKHRHQSQRRRCPRKNGRRSGSKVRQITWEWTPLTIFRKSLIHFLNK